jgi:hypothetical protein
MVDQGVVGLLIGSIRRLGTPGYVCPDNVVVEKAFAKRLPWAGWTYSFAFRLWRPKRSCTPHTYQTKLQLAAWMLTELLAARLPFAYLVADTHYTAGWLTPHPHLGRSEPRRAFRRAHLWVARAPVQKLGRPLEADAEHGADVRHAQPLLAELAGHVPYQERRLRLGAFRLPLQLPSTGQLGAHLLGNRRPHVEIEGVGWHLEQQ